eukprot:352852-Chlamydomonas_euryale.AAC.3
MTPHRQIALQGKHVFYFPLTGGYLASWPWATREGRIVATGSGRQLSLAAAARLWQADERFGSVLECNGGWAWQAVAAAARLWQADERFESLWVPWLCVWRSLNVGEAPCHTGA